MVNTILPKIEIQSLTQNYGLFSISPLEKGFGITVGNALRRVLLSSLPGAAVTSIKVDGVHHEFSSIEGAKEDTIELILNIKQLRLRMDAEDPIRLTIDRTGEGPVLAGDIEPPAGVEIVNPELRLLTLDSDDARVVVEMVVQKGKGYSPSDERGKLPIGEIPVDAIFSPVRKVNYTVRPERIGQLTNLDRVELEVWTDGTIRPLEAVTEASAVLAKHFIIISRLREEDLVPLEKPVAVAIEGDGREMPIEGAEPVGARLQLSEARRHYARRRSAGSPGKGRRRNHVDPELRPQVAHRAAGEAAGARVHQPIDGEPRGHRRRERRG